MSGAALAEARAEECLQKILATNPSLGAFVEVTAEAALAAARAADARRQPAVLLAVKDNIDVEGAHAAAGMQAYRERVALRDAPCVAALRARGAVIVGKTLMDEAALGALGDNPWFGRCQNPLHRGYTAGGSSSGSAAAVAAGLCEAALGTDTLGSVRIPASYCGIVGFVPTPGAIDLAGVMPLAPSFDRVGVLAKTARTAAGVAGMSADPARATIGALEGFEPVEDAARRLSAAGYSVVPIDARGFDWAGLRRAALLFVEREGARVHDALLQDPRSGLSPRVRAALEFGRDASAQHLDNARVRMEQATRLSAWLERYELLLLPATPQTAFAFDAPTPEDQANFTAPASVLGLPAVSVPGGTRGGLPIGVQLVASRGADRLLLGAATCLE